MGGHKLGTRIARFAAPRAAPKCPLKIYVQALLRTSTIPRSTPTRRLAVTIFVMTCVIEKSPDVSESGPEGNIGLQRIELASEGVW